MKRKNLMMIAMVGTLALTGAGIGGTLSYFTHKESVTNVFTVGSLDVDLKEPEWNPDEGDGKNIYPGYTVYKNPTVKNLLTKPNATQPCYLLMKVKALDAEGNAINDENRLSLIRNTIHYDASYTGSYEEKGSASGLTEGKVPGYSKKEIDSFPMVNPDFEEMTGENGEWVFAYKGGKDQILHENEETALFTTIAFPTDWTNDEMDTVGEFKLEISAEAIQSEGFANRTDAFAALTARK